MKAITNTKRIAERATLCLVAGAIMAFAAPFNASAQEDDAWDWTDERREGAIWTAFALNEYLSPFEFSVEVNGEEATIRGVVDDETKRILAEEVALGVNGIEEVINEVQVDVDLEPPEDSRGRELAQATWDATATTAVKSRLLWNRDIRSMDIDASTRDGVTTLTGVVNTESERDLAGELALGAWGVEAVENELTVDPDAEGIVGETVDGAADTVSDGWITTKVKSALLFTQGVPGRAIQVRTEDSVVRLSGHVDTHAERDGAIEAAQDIRGVEDVDASALLVEE
ncbi:MAG: BON domain-containing protein [Candidatus Hydrogenedentota bacterium]